MTSGHKNLDATALLLAALAAPPVALWIAAFGALIGGGAVSLFSAGAVPILEMIFGLLLFSLLVTLWGAIPAGLFGGLAAVGFERWRRGRALPRWPYALTGAATAAVYAGVSVTLGASGPVLLLAPWVIYLFHGVGERGRGSADVLEWVVIIGALVGSGALAGLIYRQAWRPQVVRVAPALYLSDNEPG